VAITYVGGITANGNSANYALDLTALTGGTNSSPSTGDIVVVSCAAASTTNLDMSIITAGYTSVADRYTNTTRDLNLGVSYKVMGGSPDTSVTVPGSDTSTDGAAACVQVFRGVDTTTPMDTTAVVTGGSNSATPNPPSITPVTVGALVVIAGAYAAASIDASFTVPSGYQGEPINDSADPGVGCACFMSHGESTWVSGAVDPAGWGGITGNTGDGWGAVSVALRPSTAVANTSNFFHFIA
jgi:hypothetical protein